MPASVWVSGEALIDLLPGQTPDTLRAIAGGGPANTALALAKLGVPVKFVSGLSNDRFGQQISEQFVVNGVDLDLAIPSDLPTSLAVVSVDVQGHATYHFHTHATATFDFDYRRLPDPDRTAPSVLHVGTLSTIVEPGATHLLDWTRRVAAHAPVVFDPNIRSSLLSDRVAYRTAVQRWVDIANVVKVSEDDLGFLYPDLDFLESARNWLTPSMPLIVVTRGEAGLVGITAEEFIEVPGVSVNVVDTVGAGDTVGAILVEALTKDSLQNLHGPQLKATLIRAAKAAAITCSRVGAQPPSAAELD